MTILDVGCGFNPKGDVNLDLFLYRRIPKREQEQVIYKQNGDVKKIPNFVCGDANNLPFRRNVFDIVVCYHVLEHIGINHIQTAKELLRVAKEKVCIHVPNQIAKYAHYKLHNKVFTRDSFHILFKNYERTVRFQRYMWKELATPKTPKNSLMRLLNHRRFLNNRVCNPLHFLPCPIPTEIGVEVKK